MILCAIILCGCGGTMTYKKFDIKADGTEILVAKETVTVKGCIRGKTESAEGESKGLELPTVRYDN